MSAQALPAEAAAPATAAPARERAGRVAMTAIWSAWGVSAALALGFLTQPVGPDAQLVLCSAALVAMAALWLLCPRSGLPRMAFLALGSLVVIRYVYWRLTGTLPSPDDPVSFGLGLLLALAELYCVMILTVSLIINAEPLARAAAPALADDRLPTVDVFIPSYNETTDILAMTVSAAMNLDYPADRFTVWLLDDGGTDQKCADADPERAAAARDRRSELQALCAALGAHYLTRARNEHAKAGNLNNGLKSSTGDLVLVLDADHAPFRPFLRETVGLFSEDPKLFLVQTPHVFLNPDPVERNLRTFQRMPSENEMFYGITQRGLDKWNGSFFCGSAALLRRQALDTVGGFSGITITEDCETAFELHARGWTSAYIDRPLIAGLQPETFADFIGQRARWCQGMFQIMLLKNPLTKPGLKPIQRLGYLSSMAFWFFPLPRLVFMLAPLLHIFFDVKIFVSSIDEALAFTATYIVANMMIQNYLYGRVRWPWISELYEYVQGVYLARSIVSVLLSPRKPSFNVTAKGVSLANDHLSPLAWPFFAIFGALAAGCATAAWRYLYEPGVTSLMLVVGLWCLFNLVIAGVALGVVAERRQPERCPSLPLARTGRVRLGDASFDVAVERVSADGCTLRRSDGAPWPEASDAEGLLSVVPAGTAAPAALPFRVVGAPGADTRSLAFTSLTPAACRSLADLMYGNAGPLRAFLEGRRRHQDLVSGSLRFLAWGVTEPVRAVSYALRRAPVTSAAAAAGPAIVIEAKAPALARAAETVPALVAWRAPTARPILLNASAPLLVAAPADVPAAEARPVTPAIRPAAAAQAEAAPTAMPRLTAEAWRAAVAELAAAETGARPARAEPPALDAAGWLASVLALAAAESGGTVVEPERAREHGAQESRAQEPRTSESRTPRREAAPVRHAA